MIDTNATVEELLFIVKTAAPLEDNTKNRLKAAIRPTIAAALGTGAGYAVHDIIRRAIAHKVGPSGTKALGLKAAAPAMAVGGILIPVVDAALRDAINSEKKKYMDGNVKGLGIIS
jgi:hypothetical protein